jgi:hypothetical protein
MQPASFRGHEVALELVGLAQSVLTGVTVFDGPAPFKPSGMELLLVGWAPFVDRHAVARRRDEDLGGRMIEDGEIACYIAVGHGDTTIVPVRERAAEILAQLEEAIRDDETGLGADEISIGPNMTLTQHQDANEGASVGLAFTVSYIAYI